MEEFITSHESSNNKSAVFHIVGATLATIAIILGGAKLNDMILGRKPESYSTVPKVLPKEIPIESSAPLTVGALNTAIETNPSLGAQSYSLKVQFPDYSLFPIIAEVCTQSEDILGLCAVGYIALSQK